MGFSAQPHPRNRKSKARRAPRGGPFGVLTACLLPLVSGCTLMDRTVDFVADVGDGLASRPPAYRLGPNEVEVGPHGDRKPVPIEAGSLEEYRRMVLTAHAPRTTPSASGATQGHRVIWDLAALPSPPPSIPAPRIFRPVEPDPLTLDAGGLESRIAPAAGAKASGPSASAPTHRSTDTSGTDRSLSVLFHPRESEISERDRARLSMLVWPHLKDPETRLRLRAYLPAPEPGIGPAPVVQVDRGRSVKRYLAHLGLPESRMELSLVGTQPGDENPHRVEVELITPIAVAPAATATRRKVEQVAEGDRDRAAALKAFHDRLKAFSRRGPMATPAPTPVETPKPTSELREAPVSLPSEAPRASEPVASVAAAPVPVQPRKTAAKTVKAAAVQLASLPDQGEADAERQRLQHMFADLLDDPRLVLMEVELEGRGRYHRIRTGPLADRSTAAELCTQLKARGQDCLVVTTTRPADQVAQRAD